MPKKEDHAVQHHQDLSSIVPATRTLSTATFSMLTVSVLVKRLNLLLPFRPTPLTIASDSSPNVLWDTSLFRKGTQKRRVRSANVAVITNTSKFLVRLPEIL